MGGGDLNQKKSWHPLRAANLNSVAKAEADAVAERKKVAARLEEIAEDRKREEIQRALIEAGGKPQAYDPKLAWMYQAPNAAGQDATGSEAYLLGKRRIDQLLQDNEAKKLQKLQSGADDALQKKAAVPPVRDMATKIRQDPLLQMKKVEQQAYEALMNDPIKRRQLLASMGMEDAEKASKKKEERSHRHKHHHRHHRHRDEDNGRSHRRRRSYSRSRSRSPRRRGRDSADRRRDYGVASDDERDIRRRRDDRRAPTAGSSPRMHVSRREDEGIKRADGYDGRRDDGFRMRDMSGRRNNSGGNSDSGRRDSFDHGRRSHVREDDAGLGGRRPDSRSRRGGHDQDERARKLAAMQEAASDLDRDRERRLAAFEEAERAAKDSDARARERDRKYGGADRQFASNLHRRAGEMRAADRIRSGRQGADQAGDNED